MFRERGPRGGGRAADLCARVGARDVGGRDGLVQAEHVRREELHRTERAEQHLLGAKAEVEAEAAVAAGAERRREEQRRREGRHVVRADGARAAGERVHAG